MIRSRPRFQVLSISQNRLKSLPAYMADFNDLKVFKIDYNPIEWPVCDFILANPPFRAGARADLARFAAVSLRT